MNGNSIIPTEREHDDHYCHQFTCWNCGDKFTPEHIDDDEEICYECLKEIDSDGNEG